MKWFISRRFYGLLLDLRSSRSISCEEWLSSTLRFTSVERLTSAPFLATRPVRKSCSSTMFRLHYSTGWYKNWLFATVSHIYADVKQTTRFIKFAAESDGENISG